MTPEEKKGLHSQFAVRLTESLDVLQALSLKFSDPKVTEPLKNENLNKHESYQRMISIRLEILDDIISNLEKRLTLLGSNDPLNETVDSITQSTNNLLEDFRLCHSEAHEEYDELEVILGLDPEADFLSADDEDLDLDDDDDDDDEDPVPDLNAYPDTIIRKADVVNLNQYPEDCLEYGKSVHFIPRIGDANACVPKLLHFALKTGLARGKANTNPQALYQNIVTNCSHLSLYTNLHREKVNLNDDAAFKTLCKGRVDQLKADFQGFEFFPGTTALSFGDLLMDRNGNDLITAYFLDRIKECGTRMIITISNHDLRFLSWFLAGEYSEDFINRCGKSSISFSFLIENKVTAKEEMYQILNRSYFPDLVAIYYEIDPNGKINNIGTHGACGEFEIHEIIRGLASYSAVPELSHLFTESQRSRLTQYTNSKYNDEFGLPSSSLRIIIDLINEIVHTNAMKPSKKHLLEVLQLGKQQFEATLNNNAPISPLHSPLYFLMENRDSPRAAPPNGEPRMFQNGHDPSDKFRPYGVKWFHNSVTFDDLCGKSLQHMDGFQMHYGFSPEGYRPMPEYLEQPTPAPQASRASDASQASPSSRERDRSPPPSMMRLSKSTELSKNEGSSTSSRENKERPEKN